MSEVVRLCVSAGRGREAESGRIGLLMGVCLFVVASFLCMSATVTAVAIEDRRLLACADRLAVATAGVIDSRAYYGAAGRVEVSRRSAWSAAGRALRVLDASVCDVGDGVSIVEVEQSEGRVRVRVRARAVLPIVPGVLQEVSAPVLSRESTARVSVHL